MSKSNSFRHPLLFPFGLALVLAPQIGTAQTLEDPFTMADKCSGPLGALLPDCQAAKTSLDIPAVARRSPSQGATSSPGSLPGSGTAGDASGAEHQTTSDFPSQPPTEFQRFVASSVGELLPVFGASLFAKMPSTFAPLDRVPVTADYILGPGDQVLLRVWGQVSLDLELPVDRTGNVFIPQVGDVSLAGIEYRQLSGYLHSQLARVFRNFDLTVSMGQLRSIQIFVVGQARRPGSYTVSSLSTLVNALFASGGPSAQGSMRRIQLKRGSRILTEFDLYDLLLKGDTSKDARLLPGDVVYVPPVGDQLAVVGSVKNPAIYELKGEKTAAEAIEMSGGLSSVADARRATLERIKQRSARQTMELSLDSSGLATPIGDGDLLRVLAVPPRFANAVTLRGNVANPGRFPWREGMRLRDVIPDKESLVTRDYWKKRNLLGYLPADAALPGEPSVEANRKPAQTGIEFAVPEINWAYAAIERRSARDLSAELIPFHLGKLILEQDESENRLLEPGDVVTIFSQSDIMAPVAQQNRLMRLEGEFMVAGIYAVRPGETLGQVIEHAGGLTPQAYLYGAEFVRESTKHDQQRRLDEFVQEMDRQLQQAAAARRRSAVTPQESAEVSAQWENDRQALDRLRGIRASGRIVLNLEPGSSDLAKLMNLELEGGDRFVVPARPATVNVLGAVYNQTALLYEGRLRIDDYLRKAGGFTRNADKARVFIIRADGSLMPKKGATSPFVRSFEAMRLYPGDSVIVPEAAFRSSLLRGLRDWSLVLSQFGLGAAAISVLK